MNFSSLDHDFSQCIFYLQEYVTLVDIDIFEKLEELKSTSTNLSWVFNNSALELNDNRENSD